MVFDKTLEGRDRWSDIDGYFARYSTFDEAEKGHEQIVARVRQALAAGGNIVQMFNRTKTD